MANIPERYQCSNCGSDCTDLIKTETVTSYNGNKTIYATYKCRICGTIFTKKVYWEEQVFIFSCNRQNIGYLKYVWGLEKAPKTSNGIKGAL